MDLNPRRIWICRATKHEIMKQIRLFSIICFVHFYLIVPCINAQCVLDFDFQSGAGMGTQIHYSKNTFRCAPGAALHFSLALNRRFDLDFRFFIGAFMGNSVLLDTGILYHFLTDKYQPSIGIRGNLDFGSVIFHTDSSVDYIYPRYPETGICITARPANFKFPGIILSFIDICIGTDLFYPGKILLMYFELIHIEYRF